MLTLSLQMLTLNLRRTVWFADADRCRTVYVADADAKFGVGQSMLQMLTLIFKTFWSTNTN